MQRTIFPEYMDFGGIDIFRKFPCTQLKTAARAALSAIPFLGNQLSRIAQISGGRRGRRGDDDDDTFCHGGTPVN